MHSKAFDGLNGNFPIGFLVWQTHNGKGAERTPITEITCEAYDKEAQSVGEKRFYNLPVSTYLNVWIKRPRINKEEAVPLCNAIKPTPGKVRVSNWSDGAVAYMWCGKNDFQHAGQQTALFSSPYGNGDGMFVNPDNLLQAAVVFTVRQLIAHTWLNHNDQFLQPNWGDCFKGSQAGAIAMTDNGKASPSVKLSGAKQPNDVTEFMTDCLLWMLFHGKNLTASADNLVWNHRSWSLTNHFFPYTEDDVGAPSAIDSTFMSDIIATLTLSDEARAVLDAGREVYRAYFRYTDPRQVREELKLGRADAGWYQIRNALKARSANGDVPPEAVGAREMTELEAAYKRLTEKIRPLVWEYEFLK